MTTVGIDEPANAQLEASYCQRCREYLYPAFPYCASGHPVSERRFLSRTGILASYSEVHLRGEDPYLLVLVDFPEGVRVLGRLPGARRTNLLPGLAVQLGGTLQRPNERFPILFFEPAPEALCAPAPMQNGRSVSHSNAESPHRSAPLGDRDVFVVGVGMTDFCASAAVSTVELGHQAVVEALRDAGSEPDGLQAAWVGSVYGGSLIGQRLSRQMGFAGIPITNVENACSSGATALHEAAVAISRGEVDLALVVGLDKLSNLGSGPLPLDQEDWNAIQGLTLPALYAMRARSYLERFDLAEPVLAAVTVKSRRHASLNPHAQFRKEVSEGEVLASRVVADPLRLLECCPKADGAAALVLGSSQAAKRLDGRPVQLLASVLASGVFDLTPNDLTRDEITERAASTAYTQSGLGPGDVDVYEVHDAFAIAELIYCETLGLAARGDAPRLLAEGATSLGGQVPVNPSGGLLSRGHPLGATGVAQAAEIVWQLRREAGNRQVEHPRVGLTHCTGGGIAGMDHGACAIHIFSR